MIFMGVNLWSVLVAAVSTMVVGFLWYSPLLFARPWMVAMGYDPDDKARMEADAEERRQELRHLFHRQPWYRPSFWARSLQITTVNTVLYGMKVGFAIWLGFVTTVQLTAKLFGNQSTRLYLINTGYQLVCYLVMGAILAVWPR